MKDISEDDIWEVNTTRDKSPLLLGWADLTASRRAGSVVGGEGHTDWQGGRKRTRVASGHHAP